MDTVIGLTCARHAPLVPHDRRTLVLTILMCRLADTEEYLRAASSDRPGARDELFRTMAPVCCLLGDEKFIELITSC